MNKTTEKLKAIGAELRQLFPSVTSANLAVNDAGQVSVILHGPGDYLQASRILQAHGYHQRKKLIINSTVKPWCRLSAAEGDDFEIKAFVDGLPPSCRLVKKIVKVPKMETCDTEDFVEIERLEVVCGNTEPENELAAQPQEA